MNECIDRRVFGAIEFVDDLTGARVLQTLNVTGPAGMKLLRNRSGLYVIRELEGEDDYTHQFDAAPTHPVRLPFTLSVQDPQARYLPQSFSLSLPRLLNAPGLPVDNADNVLRPLSIRLLPGVAQPLRATWAVLRLQVVVAGSVPPVGLVNVLVEASPSVAGLGLRRTLTDRHGEALLIIADAPPILPHSGPKGLTREFKVSISLVLDASVVRTSTDKIYPLPDMTLIQQRRAAGADAVRVVSASEQLLCAGLSRRAVQKVTWP
ncbi:MAG: hypothetical protein WCH35_06580 [Comamonadaceae bacterium]